MKIDKDNLPMKDALEYLVNKTAQPYYKDRLRAEKQDKVSYGGSLLTIAGVFIMSVNTILLLRI